MQITHVYKTDYMRLCKQGFILACILALLVIKVNATSITVVQREVYFYKPLTYAAKLQSKCELSFIGYEYNTSLAKPCKHLWKKWTQQILGSNK